ncbi:MAG: response regulator [Desulfovibrio sp.]|nr:MAG: response regulator [Desulfovibrio sp.]
MLNILIADDSRAIVTLMCGYMSKHGECSIAMTGREAVQLFDSAMEYDDPFDVVLLDIMMPEMDGLTAAKLIRELETERGVEPGCGARLVMVSCLTDPKNMMQAAYDIGADIYLTKPLDEKDLVECLANLGLITRQGGDHE